MYLIYYCPFHLMFDRPMSIFCLTSDRYPYIQNYLMKFKIYMNRICHLLTPLSCMPWALNNNKKKITCHLFNHFFYFFFAILRSPKEFYIIFFSLEFNLNLLSLFSSFEHGDSLFLKHSWNVVLVHPNNFLFSLELALIFWNFNIPLQIWSYWVMV